MTSELREAARVVELELKRLRVSRVEFEYSEGCSLNGSGGHSRAVGLAEALDSLRSKRGE